MDGMFIVIDSDISEDEFRTAINQIHQKKEKKKKNGHASTTDRRRSKPSLTFLRESSDSAVEKDSTSHVSNGVNSDGPGSSKTSKQSTVSSSSAKKKKKKKRSAEKSGKPAKTEYSSESRERRDGSTFSEKPKALSKTSTNLDSASDSLSQCCASSGDNDCVCCSGSGSYSSGSQNGQTSSQRKRKVSMPEKSLKTKKRRQDCENHSLNDCGDEAAETSLLQKDTELPSAKCYGGEELVITIDSSSDGQSVDGDTGKAASTSVTTCEKNDSGYLSGSTALALRCKRSRSRKETSENECKQTKISDFLGGKSRTSAQTSIHNQSFTVPSTHGSTVSASQLTVSSVPRPAVLVSSGISGGVCLTRCKECAAYKLPLMPEEDRVEMSNYVALDCEFVGVGPKKTSALGRCSIVDYRGAIVFDRFVKPRVPVTDYRTPWSGLRPRDLLNGIPFEVAQEQITIVIKDKIVVGHSVYTDFRVMKLNHPPDQVRDTQACELLRDMASSGRKCSLKMLTEVLLDRKIQRGEHCSVSDARATLDLFRLVRARWEPTLLEKFRRREARRGGNVKQTPSNQPKLNSFFEDQYWPADMFD